MAARRIVFLVTTNNLIRADKIIFAERIGESTRVHMDGGKSILLDDSIDHITNLIKGSGAV